MGNVILATQTMNAIDRVMFEDQGASFRQWEGKVLPHMDDAFRGSDGEGFRTHMGASLLGGECGRALWYGFRWFTASKFDARVLRLFNRGHLEEARFIAMLLTIGVQVFQQDTNGKQFRISELGGHLGGSGDGVALGVPDVPHGQYCLLEFKTHNDASFKTLKKDGVRSAKFEHYVQMNCYMRKMGLNFALYGAVNKNTDEVYFEIVPLDVDCADTFLKRGRTIIMMKEPPEKIAKSPGWRACAWCDHKPVCHLRAQPPINCRSCMHSTPREDGTWWCESKERQMKMLFGSERGVSNPGETFQLDKARQLEGCKFHTPYQPS